MFRPLQGGPRTGTGIGVAALLAMRARVAIIFHALCTKQNNREDKHAIHLAARCHRRASPHIFCRCRSSRPRFESWNRVRALPHRTPPFVAGRADSGCRGSGFFRISGCGVSPQRGGGKPPPRSFSPPVTTDLQQLRGAGECDAVNYAYGYQQQALPFVARSKIR